jgi:Na+-translocating ferredoxin:NAD+ oxidoreductase RNF subunit RnfB
VNMIIFAILSVTVIGAVSALMLSFASKYMTAEVDERAEAIEKCLPGTNCGACGFPGCAGYAAALVAGNAKNNLCTPGGVDALKKLSGILGIEAGELDAKVAVIHCRGDCNAQQRKMDYRGIQTCAAAKQLFGGEGACAYGCLGYGDCLPVCPSDAICVENGLARIITANCTGCGLCVKSCPNHLITVDDADEVTVIMCNSIDKGAVARKKCVNACLACRKCVRECPSGAITIENNLAKIDYEKCTDCAHCAETCVTHAIQPLCVNPAVVAGK